ncbi:hypothetical protein ACMGDM_16675 [Sphingomonas sp. DT-51]|uniref:hypothetical protein n=1 Tax=Sphingomonas sp. DT-51 TaxID=3396165 RepID=UPI003F197871
MNEREKLKDELEIAVRVASTITNDETALELRRYAKKVEDKLTYHARPAGNVVI